MARIGALTTVVLVALGLVLAAPATAQQLLPPDEPNSWIPERRKVEEGLTARVDPPLSERELEERAAPGSQTPDPAAGWSADSTRQVVRRTNYDSVETCVAREPPAQTMRANVPGRTPQPKAVSRSFGEAYNLAREAFAEGDTNSTLALIDRASLYTDDDPALELALEQLRTAVFAGLGDMPAMMLSLERQLATGQLSVDDVRANCATILRLQRETAPLRVSPTIDPPTR